MSTPVIDIENLGLKVSGKTILREVSLQVHKGEFFSIIGPNGAGKTSLIKCLSRIYTNWTGSMRINGVDIHTLSQRELARQLSYVPQAEGRNMPFSVYEFILMGRYPHLSPFSTVSKEDKDIVDAIIEMTGLTRYKEQKLNTMSGGERQMVFIAAALAQGADILLLDEPTSYLDYRHQAQVADMMSRLHREKGITIVSISHDINAACAQSDRILAMKDGTTFFVEPADTVLDAARLEALYETPFRIADHPLGAGRLALMEARA